jgi:hypothetical protein
MKTSTKILTVKFSIFILMLIGVKPMSGQSSYPDYIDLLKVEDSINIKEYMKNPINTIKEYLLFDINVKYTKQDTDISLENAGLEISMSKLVDLYKTLPKSPSTRISAIKIRYGFNGNTIVPLFQLATLDRVKHKKHKNVRKRKYKLKMQDTIYRYDSTDGFVIETDTAILDDYFKQVHLCHCIDADEDLLYQEKKKCESLVFGKEKDWENDSRAIIFSFQELFTFYKDAFKGDESGNKYTHNLYLYNGVSRFHRLLFWKVRLTKNRNKHTMFFTASPLSLKSPKPTSVGLKSVDQAANLAHLCPPNSQNLYFNSQAQ